MTTLSDLPTPAAVIDSAVLDRNTRRMSERAHALGVQLRPHVKTHKCPAIARLQVRGHAGGITVSTLAEARAFAREGFDDQVWALPIPLDRLSEAAELAQSIKCFELLVDHPRSVDAVQAEARRRGIQLRVRLEFDCGDHRSGVDPESSSAITLAQQIADSRVLHFAGILTHAGHSYSCRNAIDIAAVAEEERFCAARFAERLRSSGIAVEVVSVGSTPTMHHARSLGGVTEARPGNYAFHDGFQVAIGSCDADDVAFKVLATVIGQYPEQRKAIVNAGALALSKDPGATHLSGSQVGFGRVEAIEHRGTSGSQAQMFSLSQEHGQLRYDAEDAAESFVPGARVLITPHHSCLAAALFDTYYVLDGDTVVDHWSPARGW